MFQVRNNVQSSWLGSACLEVRRSQPSLVIISALSQRDSASSLVHTRQTTRHVLWLKNTWGGAHKETKCLLDIEYALKILAALSI